jgi:hypothetical protein
MPGFPGCSWCHGKGCMCCDGERAKHEKAEAKRREDHARRTPDQIRRTIWELRYAKTGQWEGSGTPTLGAHILRQSQADLDPAAIDRAIAEEEALLNAAYDREFPDGPRPIFMARRDKTEDMALLKFVAHRTVLEEAFGPDGKGIEEIERRAAQANLIQQVREVERLAATEDD